MSDEKSSSDGISFLGALGLLFIGLKLGGIIHWSWWYVTLPLWGGLVLFLGIFLIALLVMCVKELLRN
jgi:hypothetical protein